MTLGRLRVVLAPDHTHTAVMLLETNVSVKIVAVDEDSRATRLPGVAGVGGIIDSVVNHSHFHLDVERVSCPVGHVIFKFIVNHHNRRVVPVPEIWVLDVNRSARRPDVVLERVAREYDGASIAPDHEGRHVFKLGNDKSIIKLPIRINDLSE